MDSTNEDGKAISGEPKTVNPPVNPLSLAVVISSAVNALAPRDFTPSVFRLSAPPGAEIPLDAHIATQELALDPAIVDLNASEGTGTKPLTEYTDAQALTADQGQDARTTLETLYRKVYDAPLPPDLAPEQIEQIAAELVQATIAYAQDVTQILNPPPPSQVK